MDILLKELDPGQKYILQARSKSATGKTSAWSTAFEHTTLSDTVAPSPVTSLVWDAVGTSFVATWVKPATDAGGKPLKDFKDYKVVISAGVEEVTYYVAQERFDFSLEANRNAFGTPGPDLDISVQARDNTGNLSTAVTDNAINAVPADVTGLVADGVSNGVALTWDAVADTDLKYYEVYVSTVGSGFIPGPSNLVYTGAATSFLFPSTNYITHYFKVRAVDVFNQGSANYTSASATPESSTGIDLTPPDDPTNVVVTTAAATDGSSTITVDWDAVASSNLSDYLVRYSTDEVAWRYINVPSNQTSALISNLLAATNYYVQVAAMSQANVKSDFVNADTYPIMTATDTTPPSQPAAPTVVTRLLAAQVSHDMTKQGGGDLEGDVSYLEVHASETTGFTPDITTLQGTIDTAGPGIDVSAVFYYDADDTVANLYWKIIAVDRSGNKSTASNQTAGTPGLIENQYIENATITSAKINDLEANKITAGTGIINALDIKETLTIETGGHVRSSDWNATDTGWSLDNTGLTIFDGEIHAASLLLQDSANIIPSAFADFEFNEDYYHTSNVANSGVWSTVGTALNVDILETGQKFGNKCLRVFNGVITNPTVHDLVLAPGGLAATDLNIDVSPGTYIFSGYFKKNGSVDALLKFGFYPETGSAILSSASTVNSTSWTRFEAQLVVPSGVSRVKAYLEFGPEVSNTGYDFLIDGLQIERKITGATTAGVWRPPSKTTIDGGQIVTGSIRSSAPSVTDANQPAWSINTAGNMQVGDAQVRGSIVVGTSSVGSDNLVPDAFASFELAASYYAQSSNFGDPPATGTTFTFEQTGGTIGSKFFRASNATMNTSSQENVFFSPANVTSVSSNNIRFTPGTTYIVSAYVKNMDATKSTQVNLSIWENSTSWFAVDHDPGTAGVQKVDITTMTNWTRISGTWTANSQGSGKIVIEIKPLSGTGFNVGVDGLMIEEAAVGQTTPSAFVPGFTDSSFISSGNYLPGQTGWKIDAEGNAEFNKTLIRGAFETKSELGAVEINLLNVRPTVKFWNDDFSNFAYINVVDDVAGMAELGLNSGAGTNAAFPGVSIYNRLWLRDPGSGPPAELSFVRSDNQARIGGGFVWSVDESTLLTHGVSGTFQAGISAYRTGQIDIRNNVVSARLLITENGNVFLASTDRAQISLEKSTGVIFLRGGDGNNLNGEIFTIGGNGDPFFHILNEGWLNVTVVSGSAVAGNEPQVKLLPDGTCIMRGVIVNHGVAVNQHIATLPGSRYYPDRNGRFITPSESTADNGMIFIDAATGQIFLAKAPTGGASGANDTWFTGVVYSV